MPSPKTPRKQTIRVMELSREKSVSVKPAARRTHPRTGRLVLIGSFTRGVPPFLRSVHSFLAEQALGAGFGFQLSAGTDPRDWERAEGILITDPSWLTREREEELRGSRRGFVMLTARQPGPNTVFLNASGAWMDFLLAAEERKTTRILFLETADCEAIPELNLPEPLRKTFPGGRQLPLFQALPKDIDRSLSALPPELMTDGTCLLTDDADIAASYSAPAEKSRKTGGCRQDGGFWTACMLPAWNTPSLRDCSFRADPEDAAREMLLTLYRQMTTGRTSDPGAILPVLWSGRKIRAGRPPLI